MEVLDKDGKIIFLRKLKEGPAAESYGIHVARLAGLSENVLGRAEQIMEILKARDADTVNHPENKVNIIKNEATSGKSSASIRQKRQSTPKTEEPSLFDMAD